MMPMTKWVKRLLIANVAVFVLTGMRADSRLGLVLAFWPRGILYQPWGVVTYMFVHAGFAHIFFNMLVLFFFGPRVEDRLGAKRFLWLYFLSGIGGALGSFLFARQYPVVGASAAVYGVLLAFAMYWPREKIYIWMILPVEAWLLVVLAVGVSLWLGVTGSQAGIAHFAHLGGLATGFLYLKWSDWRQGAGRRAFQRAMDPGPSISMPGRSSLDRWRSIQVDDLHELNRDKVRRLLAKAEQEGARSLTDVERQFLDRMASR